MDMHKYRVGQKVRLHTSRASYAPNGDYVVTRQLPSEGGDYLYRVKSAQEGHERMVRESQIEAVEQLQPIG